MSISLSIYDVFANLLPGLLYLFALNEFLKSVGGNGLDPTTAFPNAGSTIGILAVAYILGHLFNALTYNNWYLLYYDKRSVHDRSNYMESDNGLALKSLRFQYSDYDFDKFQPGDTDLLFNAIRVKNKELADRIEVNRVNAIMMRNVSFGLFILGSVEIIILVRETSLIRGLAAIVCLTASRLALVQTSKYYHWFYKDVFQAGSLYGKSLKEVVQKTRRN